METIISTIVIIACTYFFTRRKVKPIEQETDGSTQPEASADIQQEEKQDKLDKIIRRPGKTGGDAQAQHQKTDTVGIGTAAGAEQIAEGAKNAAPGSKGKAQIPATKQGEVAQHHAAKQRARSEQQLLFSYGKGWAGGWIPIVR